MGGICLDFDLTTAKTAGTRCCCCQLPYLYRRPSPIQSDCKFLSFVHIFFAIFSQGRDGFAVDEDGRGVGWRGDVHAVDPAPEDGSMHGLRGASKAAGQLDAVPVWDAGRRGGGRRARERKRERVIKSCHKELRSKKGQGVVTG